MSHFVRTLRILTVLMFCLFFVLSGRNVSADDSMGWRASALTSLDKINSLIAEVSTEAAPFEKLITLHQESGCASEGNASGACKQLHDEMADQYSSFLHSMQVNFPIAIKELDQLLETLNQSNENQNMLDSEVSLGSNSSLSPFLNKYKALIQNSPQLSVDDFVQDAIKMKKRLEQELVALQSNNRDRPDTNDVVTEVKKALFDE